MGCEKRSNRRLFIVCWSMLFCICVPCRCGDNECYTSKNPAIHSTGKRDGKKRKEKEIQRRSALLCFLLICQFLFAVGVNLVLLDLAAALCSVADATVYQSIYRFAMNDGQQ